jgi:hypothetical protein
MDDIQRNISQIASSFKYSVGQLKPPRNLALADYQFEVIVEAILKFQNTLDNEHEIALLLTSFGNSITLNVNTISYINPSIIKYSGYVDGKPAELIQHIAQINFLMLSIAKESPNDPPRRIGFDLSNVSDVQK